MQICSIQFTHTLYVSLYVIIQAFSMENPFYDAIHKEIHAKLQIAATCRASFSVYDETFEVTKPWKRSQNILMNFIDLNCELWVVQTVPNISFIHIEFILHIHICGLPWIVLPSNHQDLPISFSILNWYIKVILCIFQ